MIRKIEIWIMVILIAAPLTGCVAVVRTHPPEPRVEVRPAMPYPDSFWIDGHWQHDHDDWVWIGGRWERKPWPDAYWESGSWFPKGKGWQWKPGHWRREAGSRRAERRDK